MLTRTAKAAFYTVAGPIMAANAAFYRVMRAPAGPVRVHLGPGQRNYIKGFVNVDANMFTAKCDVWADLRNALPFRPGTVAAAYSHHVIEHLPRLERHLRDVFRCLQPGGMYRVGGPNGDTAMEQFAQGNAEWFGNWPDNRRSIGGRLENFLMCRGEHVTILTHSFLEELLHDAGFAVIHKCLPRETTRPDLFADVLPFEADEDRAAPRTLILEATKP